MWKQTFFSLVIGLALPATSLFAAPLYDVPLPGGFFDNQYDAGLSIDTHPAAKEAYFVVDFGANGGGKHGFRYRWEGTQTADNALIALASAGGLDIALGNFGTQDEPNYFVQTLTYLSDTDTPIFGVDMRYWHYWLGTYNAGNVSWAESNFGISGREFEDFGNFNGTPNEILETLSDGGFYGFYASASSIAPGLPTSVPEPATWLLATTGLLVCLRALRRRDKSE